MKQVFSYLLIIFLSILVIVVGFIGVIMVLSIFAIPFVAYHFSGSFVDIFPPYALLLFGVFICGQVLIRVALALIEIVRKLRIKVFGV